MEKTIEIPEGYAARIEGNKVILEPKESEDERIRKFLVELVSNDKYNDYGGLYEKRKVSYDDVLAYLERKKEQQPAEWSEEDERRFISCMGKLQTADGAPTINSDWFEEHCYKHPTWKPSEEQMKALGIAIRCGIQLGTWEEDALRSLLNELKKL